MTRVAIVTAATGKGHLMAARALAEVVRGRGGSPTILDFGASHPLLGALVKLYNAVLRRPPRWMATFYWTVNVLCPERVFYRLASRWFVREIGRHQPEVILSVHPMANHGIVETLTRAGIDLPLAVALTDFAPPFWRGWAEPRAAAVTAPTAEAAAQLAAWGVPPERIHRAPIPCRPAFRRLGTQNARRAALRDLGLEDGRLTVVLSAGTACRRSALRAYMAMAAARNLASRVQAVILTGENPHLLNAARRVDPPFPAAVLPWRDDPEAVLAAADVLFSKPGGLTASEALAAGVPLLLDACGGIIPQERGNARYIVGRGAGWIVRNPNEVPGLLRAIPSTAWSALRDRARRVPGGDAATLLDVLEDALEGPGLSQVRAGEAAPEVMVASAPGAKGKGGLSA